MMFRRIDRSQSLARLIERLSAAMARQRGLPVVVGVLLVVVSFIISLINLAAHSPALDLLWTITHHGGIILALVGYLLVEPLGR